MQNRNGHIQWPRLSTYPTPGAPTIAFCLIFGRTDLRKGASEAKFDPGADFEVKKSVDPPKSVKN